MVRGTTPPVAPVPEVSRRRPWAKQGNRRACLPGSTRCEVRHAQRTTVHCPLAGVTTDLARGHARDTSRFRRLWGARGECRGARRRSRPRLRRPDARARAVTPGRRELAGAGVPRGRRHAALHGPASGAGLTDVDGNEYVDLVCSWGPMLLGHAHPEVSPPSPRPSPAARRSAPRPQPRWSSPRRSSPGTPGRAGAAGVRPAPRRRCPRSGWPAGSPAATLVVKFAGCYHGHVDSLLAAAGSGLATFGSPAPPACPSAPRADTLVLPYNDSAAVGEGLRRARRPRSPASSPRPPPATWAWSRPSPGSTRSWPRPARRHGALFVCDEVMTGFRVTRAGLGPRRRGRGLDARPDDVRQGDGRRLPGRGVRRPRRRDGACSRRTGRSTRPARFGNPVATAAGLTTLRLATDEVYDAPRPGRARSCPGPRRRRSRRPGCRT